VIQIVQHHQARLNLGQAIWQDLQLLSDRHLLLVQLHLLLLLLHQAVPPDLLLSQALVLLLVAQRCSRG
jgi:DMSO/TMAO reductase YedYZ heme-binding membrane subunit